MTSSVEHVPEGSWRFDENVVDCFDDMLARSIPQYDVMRDLTTLLAVEHLRAGDVLVDLGAARGEALALVLDHALCPLGVRALAVESAPAMVAALRRRFDADDRVLVERVDLRHDEPSCDPGRAGVVLAVLTVQFLPINYRAHVIEHAYRMLRPGGALVLVEKVLGSTSKLDETLVDTYHALKRDHGYSDEAVRRKAMSLEGVLVPVTAAWNEDVLDAAGFRSHECVWRWCNFAAWLAVRAET